MITHHPPFDLIVDYASGSLHEPVALAVACHVEMCAKCRSRVRELEAVGGWLLDAIEPVPIRNDELETVMARIDALEDEEEDEDAPALSAIGETSLPHALGRYIAAAVRQLSWRKVGRLFQEARIPAGDERFKVSIMRFTPGAAMPRHTHRGSEYTLVLGGGFSDGGRRFLPGDFAAKDATVEHSPVVDEDGECVCLVVMDAPVKLTGTVGRLVNPFLRG